MASGPGSRVEEQPPALPAKQHRLLSSRCSSVELDCAMLSPVALHYQNYTCDEVFPEPTDCHATQCPIHQRYDPSRHQVRFFSDGTPPPVPKKRLARTLSLPGNNAPQLSPLSPLQIHPQNFDNPLYMLAPIPDTRFDEDAEEFGASTGSPVPLLSFSQLSFDTPDEHLPYLFGGFDNQRIVSQGIQCRHLLFLRSTAQSVEAGITLQGGATERDVSSYRPQDFLLREGNEPEQIGDTVYYSLHSPKLPGRMLGLRVLKQPDGASSDQTKHKPSHVNVQDVIAHFQGSSSLRNDSRNFQTQDPSHPFKSDCTAAQPRGGGSSECAAAHVSINLTSVQSFLQKGLLVSVERDLPRATLEDFVQDHSSLQSTDCSHYDRRVCALLLQILTGSQHLYNISATAVELRPRRIFLVWPSRENEEGEKELEHDASETERGHKSSRWKEEMEWGNTEEKGKIQMLWRTHGSPRVVLTPLSPATSVPNPLSYIKSQIGALIQYCLHSQDSLTPLDSGPNMSTSSHRRGLFTWPLGCRVSAAGHRWPTWWPCFRFSSGGRMSHSSNTEAP
ncbi:inactive tyrosine-protein kinase PEAK1 [Anoplopoma fimbria]|uniref:inactive tyrosine-protein kinase PEAK1 n=1 Tax=Anoplopoma fimbria TaxID=229290 RepID=UPI0023EBFC46|nr:inactive tyrosine-protein kinase PEAK1 [Anoplopoma fimbria]